ncbi:MAG: SCO family protein [Beijerinckiaceae bacterium]
MMSRRVLLPLVAFLFGVLVFGSAIVWWTGSRLPAGGSVTSSIGGAFRLTAHDGRTVSEKDLTGTPSVVFFGFTHCPDVCPTALFEMTQVYAALGADADKLKTYFVTIDPERDDQALLSLYLSSFDPHIVGLTGSVADVQTMAKAYRVYTRKIEDKNGGYTMDHTALVYLMDKQGRFVSSLNLDRAPEETAKLIRSYF